MTATKEPALPFTARDRYPVMCYPMPWASPDYPAIASQMGLGSPAPTPGPKAMYMHIPFCQYLCGFCPFVKYKQDPERIRQYLVDLKREIDNYGATPYFRDAAFGSLYMGGGTASILEPEQLADLVGHARSVFTFAPDAEITLECSPITVDEDKLRQVAQAGVNRVSFGVQTFDDEVGRASDVAQDGDTSRRVIGWAQAAGIDHISIDLIYNLPGQTAEHVRSDIDSALAAGVKQVTMFPLSVMPHTKLFRDVNERKVAGIGELDHELELARVAAEHLGERGLAQTSVPDFSLPEVTYRHAQLHFTEFEDLLGLGAGAMGTVNEYTYVNVAELKRYRELTEQGLPPINAGQQTPESERPRATMAMGLRMLEVKRSTFVARHGVQPEDLFGPLLTELTDRDLIVVDDDGVRLTPTGTLFGYDVAKAFYSDQIKAVGQKLAESLARKRDVIDLELNGSHSGGTA
ncbi:coproporphyrinogen-III oxidase family protein [Lentzea nigeriaca]|uniref:coproporphyrinogen-III oxidase family protein n=1 Tax=Lentzea nigeriaca TaxID=1128665 RepID=UPI00195B5422|nr:coproporphyrinogen-III oxidase family protein [Lentzea nigeriaca]MBM7858599.1 oxygen-independent coproporphyrinogen-3 oxidase [Lentzea nigeriaca]